MIRMLFTVLLLIIYSSVSATIINVPADSITIQGGINGSTNGDTVQVQPGTYFENINFNGHIIVLGSLFLTTGDTSYISATVIDGDSAGTVVTFESGENSVAAITGFTIQYGFAEDGGGIHCSNQSGPTISRNIIQHNTVDGDLGGKGGGIYCSNISSPLIIENIISENIAGASYPGCGRGGGIYCDDNSNPYIAFNSIILNEAHLGGGIFCLVVDPSIVGNEIYNNNAEICASGGQGGGLYLSASNSMITKNVIYGNTAQNGDGGGIFISLNTPSIINNTIVSNWAGVHGGGIHCSSTSAIIKNTIFWGNGMFVYAPPYPVVSYCDIAWGGEGNIHVDPLFRDPDNGDFHLMSIACGDSADSPCIDAGDPNILDSLLDCSWNQGGFRSDMGAYGVLNVPGDYPTIQLAINASIDGDTVLIEPGIYFENINFNGHNIVLGSLFLITGDTSYISRTVIDGGSLGSVVTFGDLQDGSTAIVGFTITNGLGAGTFPNFEGGGITCQYQAKPTINNNIITGNSAFAGGGISCRQHADAVITDNTINENSASSGGGIYSYDNQAAIVNNIISGNSAINDGGGIITRGQRGQIIRNNTINGNNGRNGGGIFCYSSDSIIDSNIINDNYASYGGGVFCSWFSQPIISNNIISGNNTTSGGGGIACIHGSAIILNNTINGNSSVWGGGINCGNGSNPIISHNIISENSATDNGGGIFSDGNDPMITNNTLYFNTATNNGGGIFYEDGASAIVNTIFWGDSADVGNEIYIFSGSPTFTYCNIQNGWLGEGNIDCDPMFCYPDTGNYYLDGNSCSVGAGQNGEEIGAKGIDCWPVCDNYAIGDVNGSGSYNGLDVIFGVAFMKGGPPPSYKCECISGSVFYAMGDVNASCNYNGLDITYGVSYLKGEQLVLIPCSDCPPVR